MPFSWDDYNSVLTRCVTQYDFAYTAYTNAGNERSAAFIHYVANQDHAAIGHLCSAVGYLCGAVVNMLDLNTGVHDPPNYTLLYFMDKFGGCTMDTILTAMIGATFLQLQKFIGIEDAYRVALWNAPFNAEFYAALARGFQTWP